MSDGAQFTHAHMVRFERLLPCLPAQAWGFLADPGRLPGWYGDGQIEPRVGGAVSLMGGHIRGVVTAGSLTHGTCTIRVTPRRPTRNPM